MTDTLPVYLVDDDASVANACRYLLEGLGYEVRYWNSGRAFLAEASLRQPGCVILDMRMPDLDGEAVHRMLRERQSTLGVIMLTAHGDIDMAVESMKHGAVDFLQKPVGGKALAAAVQAAHTKSGALWQQHALQQRMESLSDREREVARLVSEGLTNRAIAEALHLAVRTVEVHRANAMQKLGAANTAELAGLWQRLQGNVSGADPA